MSETEGKEGDVAATKTIGEMMETYRKYRNEWRIRRGEKNRLAPHRKWNINNRRRNK